MKQIECGKPIAVIGYGFVGQRMAKLFHEPRIVDPPRGFGYPDDDKFYLSVICVPTPTSPSGSADVSAVEDAVRRSNADLILIKSTVPPGTTQRLASETGKRIVFSPEYMGESRYWTPPEYPNPDDPTSHRFMIVGGNPDDCEDVIDLFMPLLGPATRFRMMTSTEAEIVKYAENSFFALKVTFANELRKICGALGARYHSVREGWLDDPRVGPMHTAAFKDMPGFGGKCLPKDIAALAAVCREMSIPSTLLEAVIAANGELS